MRRPDGVEIHCEQRGDGPPVVLSPYWNHYPSVFANLTEELAVDHRVVRYDARGAGESTRTGPYDMETGAGDLAAVVESVGGEAVVVAMSDSANRAVRVAAERPELIRAVLAVGSLPVSFESIRASAEGMISSEAVVDAFMEQLGRDYRGAIRALVESTSPELNEDEQRERARLQADYCEPEAAVGMVAAWRADDPLDAALATGDRLMVLVSPQVAGAWFPPADEAREVTTKLLPDARFEVVEDGIVSRPDLTASIVRGITAGG